MLSCYLCAVQQAAVEVWGEEYIDITPKTVHNLMSRLRQKLRVAPDAPDYIASVRAVGYKFNTNAVEV